MQKPGTHPLQQLSPQPTWKLEREDGGEGGREGGSEGGREGGSEGGREEGRECVCVCVCVSIYLSRLLGGSSSSGST